MKYMHNERKRISSYHIWDDEKQDTACRMWRAGGMNTGRPGYVVLDTPPRGKQLCTMCRSNARKK